MSRLAVTIPVLSLYGWRLTGFTDLDRSNLGNARLQGLPEDVLGGDPTGKKFDWIVSVFYISYIVCQIPAVIASKLFPPRVWMAFAAMGWGISSTLMVRLFASHFLHSASVQLTPIYIYINSCRLPRLTSRD